MVTLDDFMAQYRYMKQKYQFWVDDWEECTDPQKFVYEDISIASYLIALWKNEQKELGISSQSFIDLGAGNGFLVYLLCMEGFKGRGIDLVKRKIWDKYPQDVILIEKEIHPETDIFEEDWIIANHSDELTPWVPLIASRRPPLLKNGKYFRQQFITIPCCEWDFDKKFTRRGNNLSRFLTYIEYIKKIGIDCGYNVEVDSLRIPSTRNVALIAKTWNINIEEERIKNNIETLLNDSQYRKFVPKFRTHKDKS